jgi:L-amino acid N-acyltransferase YncA
MAHLRLAQPSDADALAAIYRPYVEGTVISFELDPPSPAEMGRRLAATLAGHPWLVCVSGAGDLLGYAYGARHRDRAAYQWSVDTSVYIRQDSHRRGVGRGLYTALLAMLRRQGFHVAHAGITLPNPGSVGLHEAFGFDLVGTYPDVGYKFGQWLAVGWWRRALSPATAHPAPPLTLAQLVASAGWQSDLEAGSRLVTRG